jgi:hypothetical protein
LLPSEGLTGYTSLPETDKSFLVLFFKKELLPCFPAHVNSGPPFTDKPGKQVNFRACRVMANWLPGVGAPAKKASISFLKKETKNFCQLASVRNIIGTY